ncbi:tubulin-tyrosine ligase family [Stylonychia lemnae]|uniref:Tubulin--tyrosine ligase-like protein 9 n=1 Tax=Stylonychia lemnae TaxID=5949 RepID=A0A077ZVC4_STYLE|nr:tubulin-tyrosine ligase family [Stylonychia lemnae]|eukprot:CDW73250.1 tubulin-tyrosine ligase family [Stylonychia lemnae]
MSEYFRKYIKKEHYPNHQQLFYLQCDFSSNIKFKTTFRNCVVDSLKKRGWKEVEGEDWDLLWVERDCIYEILNHFHLQSHQKVNHYRNHYELTRKDLMVKNLKRYKKQLEKEGKYEEANTFNFFPTTYNLPGDYSLFVEEFKKTLGSVWIMKPIAKSQGKGRYIINPLLIGGKKFDMRIYCLVTNYSPLTAYLYRTGFGRFTHHRYTTNIEDIANNYVHLTNVAIQKTSENYDERLGGKWDLRSMKLYLMSKYGQEKVSDAFSQIQELIIKCLQSVQKTIINDKHCFELYGFDVLFDSNLKPWLIEINASPSMTANTPNDYEMKIGLLDDTFTTLDLEKILSGTEEQIGGFDLICRGTPVKLPQNSTYLSHLGCQNNRNQQLKKLAKSTASRLVEHYNSEQSQATGNTNDEKIKPGNQGSSSGTAGLSKK